MGAVKGGRGLLALAVAAGAIYALTMGTRQSHALFISAINSSTGVGYAAISLAFGVQQLMWGVAQPVAGALSDRWGLRRVMIGGAILFACATALIPLATNAWSLILVLGILFAAGAGSGGPAQLAAAVSRWIPETKRSVANGIINAGGSFGQFTLVPLAQLFIGIAGWQPALVILGALGLLTIPLLLYVTALPPAVSAASMQAGTLGQAVRGAFRDRSYLLLTAASSPAAST